MIRKMIRNDPSNNALTRYPSVVTKIARMGFWLTIIFALYMSVSSAHACDFRVSFFGDSKEKVKLDRQPLLFPDQWGGESLAIPMEDLCENDDSLYGTTVIYLYIEDELSQIRLERPLMNDKKLMDYAMRKYGSFDLPTTEIRDKAINLIAEEGALMLGCGTQSIRFRPHLNITTTEIDLGLDMIDRALNHI